MARSVSYLRVEQRVMAIFCHLASRTGTVTPDGVLLPQQLAHRQIADLVGARRPTVTLALTFLQNHDLIRRREDGRWLLAQGMVEPTDVDGLLRMTPSGPGRDQRVRQPPTATGSLPTSATNFEPVRVICSDEADQPRPRGSPRLTRRVMAAQRCSRRVDSRGVLAIDRMRLGDREESSPGCQ